MAPQMAEKAKPAMLETRAAAKIAARTERAPADARTCEARTCAARPAHSTKAARPARTSTRSPRVSPLHPTASGASARANARCRAIGRHPRSRHSARRRSAGSPRPSGAGTTATPGRHNLRAAVRAERRYRHRTARRHRPGYGRDRAAAAPLSYGARWSCPRPTGRTRRSGPPLPPAAARSRHRRAASRPGDQTPWTIAARIRRASNSEATSAASATATDSADSLSAIASPSGRCSAA